MISSTRCILTVFAALLLASVADAQIQPPSPTANDPIVVTVWTPYAGFAPPVVIRDGSEIRLTFRGSASRPAFQRHDVALGKLPVGEYTVVMIVQYLDEDGDVYEETRGEVVTFAVTEANLPALDDLGTTLLVAILGVVGFVAIRRL
jgi:hypothetical protein